MAIAKPGVRAPDFSLPGMNGDTWSLQAARQNGPVLLAFFKVSCPTCQYAFPFLERLHRQLPSAAILGVSQDVKRKAEQFNRDYGVSFPVLLDPEDQDYPASNAFGITHVPSLFLIEPDASIALSSAGFVKADLEQIARRLGPVALFHKDERVESFRAG